MAMLLLGNPCFGFLQMGVLYAMVFGTLKE